MKRFPAKYAGQCSACGREIEKGTMIKWSRSEGAFHENCAPTGPNGTMTRADTEYHQGMADVDNWHENISMFGQEAADAMEIEREMREGWDY